MTGKPPEAVVVGGGRHDPAPASIDGTEPVDGVQVAGAMHGGTVATLREPVPAPP